MQADYELIIFIFTHHIFYLYGQPIANSLDLKFFSSPATTANNGRVHKVGRSKVCLPVAQEVQLVGWVGRKVHQVGVDVEGSGHGLGAGDVASFIIDDKERVSKWLNVPELKLY